MDSKRLGLVLVFASATSDLSASSIRITPRVIAAFSADGDFTPISPVPDFSQLVGFPLVYEVGFFMDFPTADLVGTEGGFANVAFDVFLRDGVERNSIRPLYERDTSTVPTPHVPVPITMLERIVITGESVVIQTHPFETAPRWASNGDAGADGADLKNIIVETIPLGFGLSTDLRRRLGQDQSEYMGSVFVDWDGVTPGRLDLVVNQFSHYDGAVPPPDGPVILSNGPRPGGTVLFGVPEPSTWGLLAVGCIGLVASRFRRKR